MVSRVRNDRSSRRSKRILTAAHLLSDAYAITIWAMPTWAETICKLPDTDLKQNAGPAICQYGLKACPDSECAATDALKLGRHVRLCHIF